MIDLASVAIDSVTLQRLKAINGCALSTTPTLHASYKLARAAIQCGVSGDFVECGVYAGSQCGAMALAIEHARNEGESSANKVVHCFDSFCGFPKASSGDSDEWQQRLGLGSAEEPSKPLDPTWGFDTKMSAERVKSHFQQWGFALSIFEFHEGWFEKTVPQFNKPIALLRLDGDLYASTLTCLRHLYPLLSSGGVCVVDDYAVDGCRRACEEYFEGKVPAFNEIDPTGPVWWEKPWVIP